MPELDSGDVIVAELQFRVRDIINCSSNFNVVNGAFLSNSILALPSSDDSAPIGSYSLGTSETMLGDENFKYFHKTGAITLTESMEESHIGLWVKVLTGDSGCVLSDGVRVSVADLVITVYKNE